MDVIFAVVPFADVNRPTIGVSLLKSEIGLLGFSSQIEYFNIRLAELIGKSLYKDLADGFSPDLLLGEWFFADAVFGDAIPHQDDYIAKIFFRSCGRQEAFAADLLRARAFREHFLNECALRILRLHPKVVGFTTTFHQTCACLAIAKRLKASPGAPVIVFGGANCEEEMGLQLIRSFPWIDFICSGESDTSFPALLVKLLRNKAGGPIPGVLERGEAKAPAAPEPVKCMDALPIPDFGDYFDQVKESPLISELHISLQMETSRGCWWGAKKHCTFCGLNHDTIQFRSKSPERAFEELLHLVRTYNLKRIECVDNILDLKYVTTLFPKLKKIGLDLELFYEVKANLRYEQLVALRGGGVRAIQPGIESFSDEVLRLMRKGSTGFQNIQLLRWSEELGVHVAWNILAGFPGESPAEYKRMAGMIPLLTHLPPPASCARIRLDRFSPFFSQAQDFGFVRIRPVPAYFYVFPLDGRELAKLAYFFNFEYADGRDPNTYLSDLQREVERWCAARMAEPGPRPKLDAEFTSDGLVVTDTREVASAPRHHLTGIAAEIYVLCDSAQTVGSLLRHPSLEYDKPLVRPILAALRDAKLLMEVGEQFVSLAVFRNRPEDYKAKQDHVCAAISKTPPSKQLLRLV